MNTKKSTGYDVPDGYELNLSDFALFLSVMKNKEAYECLLGIIMDEDNLELKEVKVEQVILNKAGKRAIRLDAWAIDRNNRQFNTEMQNDTTGDDVRKRSRYYQGMIDSPILKSGKETKYKQLPSTVIVFITQEDIFEQDRAMYTFTEQCEEIRGLHLEDGTMKIFLNMKSRNGRPELISLLQYLKKTELSNPDIWVKDKRILKLDGIVQEVRQSEEWEGVKMNLIEYGIAKGQEIGIERGLKQGIEQGEEIKLIKLVYKKLEKGKSAKMIAEELEEDENQIQRICSALQESSSNDNWIQIYELLKNKNNNK